MFPELSLYPPIPQVFSLLYSIAYLGLLYGLLDLARQLGRLHGDQPLNLLAVGASLWVLGAVVLFVDWYWAVTAPVIGLGVNLVSRRNSRGSVFAPEPDRWGGLVFNLVLIAAILIGWLGRDVTGNDMRPLAAFIALPAGCADSFSTHFGRLYGKGEWLHGRSFIGTLAGTLGALVAFAVLLCFFGRFSPTAILLGAAGGILTGLAELFTPTRFDNLSTAVVSGIVGYLILLWG